MAENRKTNLQLVDENQRLRAQVAQLEDKLDHLSEHGATAKALHMAEALHREVMISIGEVALITDEASRLTYVSPNAHLVFGHAASDILKHGRVGFVLPGEFYDRDVLEQRGEISNINCQIRDSVGRARDLLVTVRLLEADFGRILYTCRDVSERIKIETDYEILELTLDKRIEMATHELRDSRDRYRRLVEGLHDEYFFYCTDMNGVILYVSPSSHTIFGRSPEQSIGRNWREFMDTTSPDLAHLEHIDNLRRTGLPTPPYRALIPHVNGEKRMLEFRDTTLRDADGKIVAIEGIGKDVTLRYRAEEELREAHEKLERRVEERTAELVAKNEQLRESQERYLSVIQDHLEFIIRWREDGIRTFVNESYCSYLKATNDELLGTSFMASIIEDDKDELLEKLAEVSIENPVVVHEHRTTTRDGRTAWEHWTHRALFTADGELSEFQSVGRDVTDRHRHEEYASAMADAADRMEALTDRERDVMRHVVAGDANKVVARRLGLSIKTIEKHRSSLMKKLHVRSVPELVRLALLIENANLS
jgi:PAS domain S-box-containing protein